MKNSTSALAEHMTAVINPEHPIRTDSPDRLAPALLANWRTWMRARRANMWINQFPRQRKVVDELGRTFNCGRLFQASYNE